VPYTKHMDNNYSPMYSDEMGMPASQMPFTPDHSKRNRIILIAAIIVLLVGAFLLWWFVLRSKPAQQHGSASTNTSSQQASKTSNLAGPGTIYVSLDKQSVGSDVVRFNLAGESDKTVVSTKNYIESSVELPDGTLRTMTTNTVPDGDTTTESITIQDAGKAAKQIYMITTSQPDQNISKVLWPGTLNADGTRVYFYEADNTAQTARIAYVNVDTGAVTDVITYKAADGKSGLNQFKGPLTPGAISRDGNVIYFHEHACLNCDGPPYADIIAYNVATKSFFTPFADPNGLQGEWTKLSDSYFAITTSSLGTSLAPLAYEKMSSSKQHMYLFDVQAGKAITVFDTGGTNFSANALGMSSDNKTFYYSIDKIVRDAALTDDNSGHTFHYETNEIRAYDVANTKSATLTLPIDSVRLTPSFLTSNGTYYIYGAGARPNLFGSQKTTLPYEIYRSAMADTKNKITLASYGVDDISGFSLLGYSSKQ
jgi:cytoskeletal protein RodZ